MNAPAGSIPDDNAESVSVKVVLTGDADQQRWDDFVQRNPQSTFFHRFGWSRVVQDTYGHEPFYLLALNTDQTVCGVLPLILVKSPFFGRSLVSTAFTVGGGILADSEAAIHALAQRAATIADEAGVQYIEYRGGLSLPGWKTKAETYAGFAAELPADEDASLRAIPKKRRADLRKALKAAGEGQLICSTTTRLDTFYDLYARSVRNLGTPVMPRKWIENIADEFADEMEVSVVSADGRAVAALLSFYHGPAVLPYYVGATVEARKLHAFDYVYWMQMRRAADRGCTLFDFGRSKVGTGAYAYKTFWGIEPAPLTYHYHLITANSVPDINPNNPKFTLMTRAWQKLPLPVANFVGPLLAGNFA